MRQEVLCCRPLPSRLPQAWVPLSAATVQTAFWSQVILMDPRFVHSYTTFSNTLGNCLCSLRKNSEQSWCITLFLSVKSPGTKFAHFLVILRSSVKIQCTVVDGTLVCLEIWFTVTLLSASTVLDSLDVLRTMPSSWFGSPLKVNNRSSTIFEWPIPKGNSAVWQGTYSIHKFNASLCILNCQINVHTEPNINPLHQKRWQFSRTRHHVHPHSVLCALTDTSHIGTIAYGRPQTRSHPTSALSDPQNMLSARTTSTRVKPVLATSMSCTWSLVYKHFNCLWSLKRRFTKEMGQMGWPLLLMLVARTGFTLVVSPSYEVVSTYSVTLLVHVQQQSFSQTALRRTKESASQTLSGINHPCLLPNTLNMKSDRMSWYNLVDLFYKSQSSCQCRLSGSPPRKKIVQSCLLFVSTMIFLCPLNCCCILLQSCRGTGNFKKWPKIWLFSFRLLTMHIGFRASAIDGGCRAQIFAP